MLEGVPQETIVIGHTHSQFDRRVAGHRIVNSGSVGAAWEAKPGAYWALIDGDQVELRRTEYDVEAAIRVLSADDPNRELREQWIRGAHDPSAIARQIETALGRIEEREIEAAGGTS